MSVLIHCIPTAEVFPYFGTLQLSLHILCELLFLIFD